MIWIKRIAAVCALFLGSVGVLASIAAIIAIWTFAGRLQGGITQVSERLNNVGVRVETSARRATSLVAQTQSAARDFNTRLQTRVEDGTGLSDEELEQLERTLYAAYQRTQDWFGIAESAVEVLDEVVALVNAVPNLLGEKEELTRQELVAVVRTGYQEVVDTAGLVEELKVELNEARSQGTLAERAAGLSTLFERIDASLIRLVETTQQFEGTIVRIRNLVKELTQRIQRVLWLVALVASFLFAWFGCAQFALAYLAWHAGCWRPTSPELAPSS